MLFLLGKQRETLVRNSIGDGRSADVLWSVERRVENLLLGGVLDALHLVEVERIFAGQRAVEARLHERGPVVARDLNAARVVLANARDARINNLRMRKEQAN